MLVSGTTQDGDGNQHPISERMQADLLARVRETKLAHKQHIQRMDSKRDYILGGREIQTMSRITHGKRGKMIFYIEFENEIEIQKLGEAGRLDKKIYCSLWTE